MGIRVNVPAVDLFLLAVMVIQNANLMAVKVALREIHPLAFNSIGVSLASVVLLILAFSTGVTRLGG